MKMRAAILVDGNRVVLDEKPIPDIGPNDALLRVTTTTICTTDLHVMHGGLLVPPRRTMGHEPVGIIEKLGAAVTGFEEGERVISGSITPSGWSHACLCGFGAQDGAGSRHGWQTAGGWKLGNTIDGCQADYVVIPDAMVNLAPVPHALSDEQVLMCPDIMSTGFSGAEVGNVKIGDAVAIFAQGPVGLTATAGARLMGATTIIAVDTIAGRLDMARRMGADLVIDYRAEDPVEAIMRYTDGRGVDVSIEALGSQLTFESALRVLRPGGRLVSLGVYSADLRLSLDAFGGGVADKSIVSSVCPGGKERMRRLMDVLTTGRADFSPMVTHRFKLEDIESAYALFAEQRDGVLKIAITP
jgi:alcohol dehydrogenase